MKARTQRHTILVVEDEPAVLLTYRMILEQHGYEVVTAASALEARQALARQDVDLLLCDLSLDEPDTGFELIAFARRRRPAMLSVLLTGYAGNEVSRRAQQIGVAVLFKPIEIPEFLGTIAAHLDALRPKRKTG